MLNSVIFQGRLTGVPKISKFVSGMSVANFSIAVDRKVKREGQPTVDFFDCEAWDRDAENIHRYFNQGDMILLRGRLENNNYTTRAGTLVKGQKLVVEEWTFEPKKKSE